MCSQRKTSWLRELRPGICGDNVVVKVDRIITVEQVRDQLEYDLPSKALCRYELVVFDESLTRMMLELDSEYIWDMFAGRFSESRTYRVADFVVSFYGRRIHPKYHLKFRPDSVVDEIPLTMPKQSFNMSSLYDYASLDPRSMPLLDVYGFLKDFRMNTLTNVRGFFTKELILDLEDDAGATSRGNKFFKCCLIGESAEVTYRVLESLPTTQHVYTIIQYPMPEIKYMEGLPMMTSYFNGTRVFFNPLWPQLEEFSDEMVRAISPTFVVDNVVHCRK